MKVNLIKNVAEKIQENNLKNNINLELNGVRGTACLLIFIFHCWVFSGNPDLRPSLSIFYVFPLYGAYAVDLFFVLSGFFIILPYVYNRERQGKKMNVREYYKKKAIRIFPPYYLSLLAMFGIIVPAVIGIDYLFSENGVFMLIAHLTFLQYLHPGTSASLGINGALWTLSVIFQFFLVFPIIKNLFIDGREKYFLVVFAFISVGWKYLSWYDTGWLFDTAFNTVKNYGVDELTIRFFLSNQLPAQLSHFAIGMFVGSLYAKQQNLGRIGMLVALIGLASTLYSFRIANLSVPPWWYWWRLWLGFGSGCLIYLTAVEGPRFFKSIFRNKYLGMIGYFSYEIYLWHLMILYCLIRIGLSEQVKGTYLFWTLLVVCGTITITISFCSVELVSKVKSLLTSKRP